MLRELSVQNLALIEDATLELENGFCALTGETGAGKSLLLTALGLILGEKASAELVRAGRDEARAAAVFELADPALRAEIETILGGSLEDSSLVITRRISAQGRSSAHVNGLPTAVATLRALGARLVDVHGQHQGRALLEPESQREALDAFGQHNDRLAAYRAAHLAHEALRKRRRAIIDAASERERLRALLAFERDELEALEPRAGEYAELAREAHRLANAGALRAAAEEAYAMLYEADHCAQGLLAQTARRLEPLANAAPEVAAAAAELTRLAGETREVAYSLHQISERWNDDPARLDGIEERLARYRRLATRFRLAPDDLPARWASVDEQLRALDRDESDLAALDAPLEAAWQALKLAAQRLSAARRRTSKTFARAVQSQLQALGLGEACLSVEVTSQALGDDPAACATGAEALDRVELLFAPNVGEPLCPLRRIASGGELSRVTLAAHTVLAETGRVPTLVFDEIDAGVGGRLGAVLGKKPAALGRHHQVICVTHLPQLASYAEFQWAVRKHSAGGRTRTTIERLGHTGRVRELALMLRGDSAASGTRREARSMLLEARKGA